MRKKSPMPGLAIWSLLLVLFLAIFLMADEELLARAGGGHNYSSGGGSSGSYRSSGGYSSSGSRSSGHRSSSGDGEFIILIIHLFFRYPYLMIPLTLIIVFLVKSGYIRVDNHIVDTAMVKVSRVRSDVIAKASLTQLKSKDPEFDEKYFAERARQAFRIIQQAWSERNLEKAQAFLSDGIYEQFSIQLGEMREKGVIDHMEKLEIGSCFPVGFQAGKNFDVIHLRINASAINYRKNEKTGAIIDGRNSVESFAEVWSFLRKPGVKTQKKPGLMEGQCPNCGNPVKIGRLAKCDVCSALLRSGEYDWVLAGITQACEWAIRPERMVPGLEELGITDPGFSLQHVKERAALMFWRKIESERTGRIEPMRKIARDEFCDGQKQWLAADETGTRRYYTSCAVGAIELLGIVPGNPDDHLYVEVIWSGWPTMYKPGQPMQIAASPINFRHVFILGRRHGAATRLESSLASSHCPSCGAPEQTGSDNSCSYCGSVMNDGQNEWVLEAVADRNDMRVGEVLRQTAAMIGQKMQKSDNTAGMTQAGAVSPALAGSSIENEVSGIELLRWTVAMMLADGKIDDRELEVIKDIAIKRDINESRLQKIMAELQGAANPVDHVMQTSPRQADHQLLRLLVRVALADGNISDEERSMLLAIGQKLKLVAADVDMLVTKERAALYREAKDILRQAKKQ
jgi:uncharacterized membrane protein YebE (DUF533 family)